MKIHINLFCLIVALATSITDGRISSSSSSSSSLSQPVGGSAVDVNPNRRVLQPAVIGSETQYCTAIDLKTGDGKQRGVVDWQDFDHCNKCESGWTWWPCDGNNLCEGQCTPKEVCNERLEVAAAAAATDSDCSTVNAAKDSKITALLKRIDELEVPVPVPAPTPVPTPAPPTAAPIKCPQDTCRAVCRDAAAVVGIDGDALTYYRNNGGSTDCTTGAAKTGNPFKDGDPRFCTYYACDRECDALYPKCPREFDLFRI